MNHGTSNKAVPGLFPDLHYQDARDKPYEPACEATSVDSTVFKQMVNELPKDYELDMKQDAFYLTRKYLTEMGNGGGGQQVTYTTFQEYDDTVRREFEMRQRLRELESALSNNGIKLKRLDDMNALYTRDATKRNERLNSFVKAVRKIYRHRRRSTSHEHASLQIGPQKSNLTTVIDNIKPECGFIDVQFEKNLIEFKEELETGPIVSIEGVEEPQGSPRKPASHYIIRRKLRVRHLQMISLGATIGVGLFLNSGKAFSIAGPIGALIGFTVGGSLILATLFSFAEMVALIPLITGISGLCSRFVGDSFGFSVGWCHWLSYAMGFPSEVIASTIMLSYYKNMEEVATKKSTTALTITAIVVGLTAINLMDVRVYGEFEYFSSAFKLLVVFLLIIIMIVMNAGGLKNEYIGFRYWNSNKSPISEVTFGPFRPTFDLQDKGFGSRNGVPGFGGVVLSCIASSLASAFAYVGSEIGFIAAGEARNPRKAVPSVTKRIFTRVIVFYLLSIFVVGLNIYSGDPRLLRFNNAASSIAEVNNGDSGYQAIIDALGGSNCQRPTPQNIYPVDNPNQSPWVIAMQSINQCTLSSFINGVSVAIGISAASSQLYASSRTLYSMATQQKAPSIFTWCNRSGVPYMCVLFCGLLGFLSLLCLDIDSAEVFFDFVSIGAVGSIIVWLGMNLSYLRFYYALKQRPDIVSRDAKEYPYKSPCQPYLAIYGMVLAVVLIVFNGFQNFFQWNTKNFVTSYLTLTLFIVLMVGYGWAKGSKFNKLEQMDLDSGRREMDRVIWKEDLDYSPNWKEAFNKLLSHL
ncbi:SPS-sensor component SSY1 [Lachancea thermotolerans]